MARQALPWLSSGGAGDRSFINVSVPWPDRTHVPVECICARHAKGVLSTRINKSDVHDAEGLAQLARTGWFKRVHMKASATHIDRAALRIRTQLITTRVAM